MSTGAVIVVLASAAVIVKLVAFVPDNRWLWKHSPAIVAHLNRSRPRAPQSNSLESVETIERIGLGCKCHARVPPRPVLPAILAGLRPGSEAPLPSAISLCLVPMRTPVLAICFPAVLASSGKTKPDWLLTGCAFALVVLATATLLQAPLLRWHLGRYDMEHSDLRSFTRFAPRGGRGDEGLAIYFIGLVVVSVLLYAGVYQALSASTHSIGSTSPHRTVNLITWAYFSVETASTLGFGDFYASGWEAQIAVTLQVLTGPLLFFWLISARVVGSRGP